MAAPDCKVGGFLLYLSKDLVDLSGAIQYPGQNFAH
jgi:hypothetical protein